ncbi:hypothetical protein CLV62_10814 [Dysgonomonas alginatilytica]|uniref:Uncharacterized protein n=1 Tax=Dysgonomonas alginatilytica TaxID=1605892 RepID=A0A2V3PP73_9BACT|nr:hypothetical protein [Dysgonomonas alginatilytica]PXV65016.1 hypothetical protein CLV62_10814 [Dysgonomonas alginatilytica]
MFYLIIENIFSCFIIALVVTILLILIGAGLVKWIYPRFKFNPLYYILLLFVAVMLFIQVFLLAGATYAKGYISEAEEGMLSVKELFEEYPAMKEYSEAYINTDETQEQIKYSLEPLYQYFRSYIWKRIIWIAGIESLLVVFFIYQVNNQNRRGKPSVGRTKTNRRSISDF